MQKHKTYINRTNTQTYKHTITTIENKYRNIQKYKHTKIHNYKKQKYNNTTTQVYKATTIQRYTYMYNTNIHTYMTS